MDGFLWFLNHLPSMVWIQISIAILLIYAEKKTSSSQGFFVGTHRGLLMVHWMAQGMARARNTFCTSSPKSFSSWPEFREIKDSTFKHSQYVLSFPHLLLMHLPQPWWSFLAWQIYDESPKVWLAHARAKIQYQAWLIETQKKMLHSLMLLLKKSNKLKLYSKLGWVAASSSKSVAPGYTHPTEDIGKWCPCSCDSVAQDWGGNAKILSQRACFQYWRVKQEGSGNYWKNIENHERNRIFTFKPLPSCPKKCQKPWPWKGLKLWVSPYGFHRMMQQQGMQRWPATSCSLPDNKENDKIAVDANDNQKYIIRYSSCQSVFDLSSKVGFVS